MTLDQYTLEYEEMKEDRHRFRQVIKLKRNKGKQNNETRNRGYSDTNDVVSQTDTPLPKGHRARSGANNRGDTSTRTAGADRTDDDSRDQQSTPKRIVVADELDDLE